MSAPDPQAVSVILATEDNDLHELARKCVRPNMSNAVIMPKAWWDTLPAKPIPQCVNIVVTDTPFPVVDVDVKVTSITAALESCLLNPLVDRVFLLGWDMVTLVEDQRLHGFWIQVVYGPPGGVVGDDFETVWEDDMMTISLPKAVGSGSGSADGGGVGVEGSGGPTVGCPHQTGTPFPDPCIGFPFDDQMEPYLRLVNSVALEGFVRPDKSRVQSGVTMTFDLRADKVPCWDRMYPFSGSCSLEVFCTLNPVFCMECVGLCDWACVRSAL
jgi:hypothetical protein